MIVIEALLAIQINIFMSILLSIVTAHAYFKLDRKNQIHQLFLFLLFTTLLVLLLEIISVVLNSTEYKQFIFGHKLVDTIGFIIAPFVSVFSMLYVYKVLNKYRPINILKNWRWSIPLLLNTIMAIGSYKFGWIFNITPENIYMRGKLFFISPTTMYFYYFMNVYFLFRARKKISSEALSILSLLTIIPAILSIFQLKYFVYLTIWNSVAIAVVINYIYLMHNQTKCDPLTGLGNRIAYQEYLDIWGPKKDKILTVLNIDLDDFKIINDRFGHHEGDKVLKFFARKLESVFAGKGVALRLGGDEFMVLIREGNREKILQRMKIFQALIDNYNANNDLSYRIKFSYGLATFAKHHHNVQELILDSDKAMYDEKRKRKERQIKF